MKKISLLALYFVSSVIYAQNVTNADLVIVSPAVSRDASGIKSCGVNLMVASASPGASAVVYDFSTNVWNTMHGVVKAGSQTVPFSKAKGLDFDKMAVREPAPEMFWIAKRDDTYSIRPEKYIKAENKGYILAGASVDSAMGVIMAITNGEPMQVSLQYGKDRIHRVLAFRATMPHDDQAVVLECFSALMKRMEVEGPPN